MDGIIFDLDGTLWDSTEEIAKSWNQVLELHTTIKKHITAEDLKRVFGKPLEEIFATLFPEETKEYLEEISYLLYKDQHEQLAEAKPATYPGVVEGIKKLSEKLPVFIVSNCQAGYIEVFLGVTELGPYITDYTCPGITGVFKAENIKMIMERNNLEKILYVGDTAGDKMACDKAGVPMIHAKYGFGEVENPFMTIENFTDVLDIDFQALEV